MKKKILIISLIVLLIVMLIPIPLKLKDGGSVEYRALLYRVTKIHKFNDQSSTKYEDGLKIEILGIQIYNVTNINIDVNEKDKCELVFDPNTCMNCYEKIYEFEDGTKVYSSCDVKYKTWNIEISLYDALKVKLITLSDLENEEGLEIVKPNEETPFSCID